VIQLEEALETIGATLGQLDNEIELFSREFTMNVDDLTKDVEENREATSNLALEFNATKNPINALRRELQLVKVMELITRSRVSLDQGNIGLAEADIRMARDLLLPLQYRVFDFQREALLTIISRLDLALANFPADLDLVETDLEVAWDLLVAGLPVEPSEASEGAALEGELTPPPAEGQTGTSAPDELSEATPTATP
jgi:hypothetical protein